MNVFDQMNRAEQSRRRVAIAQHLHLVETAMLNLALAASRLETELEANLWPDCVTYGAQAQMVEFFDAIRDLQQRMFAAHAELNATL